MLCSGSHKSRSYFWFFFPPCLHFMFQLFVIIQLFLWFCNRLLIYGKHLCWHRLNGCSCLCHHCSESSDWRPLKFPWNFLQKKRTRNLQTTYTRCLYWIVSHSICDIPNAFLQSTSVIYQPPSCECSQQKAYFWILKQFCLRVQL